MQYKLLTKQMPDGVVVTGEAGCGQGHCPAVLTASNGKVIVVGRLLSKSEHKAITRIGILELHEGEYAVEVSPELLRQAAPSL